MQTANKPNTFNSLSEIQAYKGDILKELHKDEEKIATLWNGLFHSDEDKYPGTPAQKFSRMISIGGGVFDGLLLGWKLYRRFKGTTTLLNRKRHR